MRQVASVVHRLAWIEGVSFLVLLGIAMPLRHFADMPRAVTVCGWVHGVLFLALCAVLWQARRSGWPTARVRTVFVAALLPFGPFVIERRLRAWEQEGPTALGVERG